MEYSMLIGKPVLSAEGRSCGYVKGLQLSKNLSALVCFVCIDAEEEEFFVPASALQTIGDAVIIGKARLKTPTGIPCPVGKGVFDENGNFLGGASALTDGENGILTVIGTLGAREFPVKYLEVGEKVIVRYEKKSIKKSAPRKPRPVKSEVPPSAKKAEEPLPKQIDRQTTQSSTMYRSNLLGRRLQRQVCGLAEAGETVTAEMLRRARESNRLLELTAGVLTE